MRRFSISTSQNAILNASILNMIHIHRRISSSVYGKLHETHALLEYEQHAFL